MAEGRVQIIRFDERYLPAFVALNREWIQKYFALEAMDLRQLENPRENVLAKGGEILFVLEGSRAAAKATATFSWMRLSAGPGRGVRPQS